MSNQRVFTIQEVAHHVGVKPYVLRYWENEFPYFKTQEDHAEQRIYSSSEIKLFFCIKHLLWVEKENIQKVKEKLNEIGILPLPIKEVNKKTPTRLDPEFKDKFLSLLQQLKNLKAEIFKESEK